ncbi:MAG TPA: alpha-ketoglutarate-dependent dioxygenase AlkB [Acidimicrobiales bacterium]|nr:alpha-ketoglutarate-dependent dioxygenase AlkB [Acidimicrobiales bacterium]
MTRLIPREPLVVAAGAVLLPGWLDSAARRSLLASCRMSGEDAGGFRSPRVRAGVMSVQITCLGWHWFPYRYSRTVDDGDGRPVKPFPDWLGDLSRRAVEAARSVDARIVGPDGPDGTTQYRPDVALINWYGPGARMGMHADRDERSPAPVVSFSLGQTCTFRFGSTAGRGRPWTDVALESGDLFVFGGPSRLAYHGVPGLVPGTGDPDLDLNEGRFNITVRQSGLGDPV